MFSLDLSLEAASACLESGLSNRGYSSAAIRYFALFAGVARTSEIANWEFPYYRTICKQLKFGLFGYQICKEFLFELSHVIAESGIPLFCCYHWYHLIELSSIGHYKRSLVGKGALTDLPLKIFLLRACSLNYLISTWEILYVNYVLPKCLWWKVSYSFQGLRHERFINNKEIRIYII